MTIVGHGFGIPNIPGGGGLSVVRNVEVVLVNREKTVNIVDRLNTVSLRDTRADISIEPRVSIATLDLDETVISTREPQIVAPAPRKVIE